MRYFKLGYIIAVIFNITMLCLAYLTLPQYRYRMVNEDSTIENASALCYAGAFLLGTLVLFLLASRRQRIVYAPIPLLGLLGLLDELSFGERIFHFEPITIAGRHRIDAIHDIVPMLVTIIQENIVAAALLGLAVGAGLLWLALRYRKLLGRLPEALYAYPAYGYVLAGALLVVVATGIDVVTPNGTFAAMLEEVFEMNGGFSLVVATIAMALYHLDLRRFVRPGALREA